MYTIYKMNKYVLTEWTAVKWHNKKEESVLAMLLVAPFGNLEIPFKV